MLDNNLVVLRFGLTSKDKSKAEIFKISSLAVDPRNLTVYPGSHFEVWLRPTDLDAVELDAAKASLEEIEEKGIDPAEGWVRFADFCRQWNWKGRSETRFAPIPVGWDLINRDLIAYDRYAIKFRTTREVRGQGSEGTLFNSVHKYDLAQFLSVMTESLGEFTHPLNFDAVAKYFEMPRGPSEIDEIARLALKVLNLTRGLAPRVIWASCFNEEKVEAERLKRQGLRSKQLADQEEREARQAKLKNKKHWGGSTKT